MKKFFINVFFLIVCWQWTFADSTVMTFNGTSTTANGITFSFSLGSFTNSSDGTTLSLYDDHPYGTSMNGGNDYADIQISQIIYIESIYISWATNVQSAVIQFYNGDALNGQVSNFNNSLGVKNVNCYADKIRILDAEGSPNSNGGGVEISQVTFNTSGVWTGATDSDWGTASNWDDGNVPGPTKDVAIPDVTNDPVISATTAAEVNNLTVQSSATLSIQSDASNNGSLIVNGTSSGNVTYNRYVTANNWHLLSSPVNGQAINDFSSEHSIAFQDPKYGIAPYDNSTSGWSHYTTSNIASAGNFTPGKGYEVMRTEAGVLPFTGTVNTSPVTIGLTTPDGGKKWNLIGNPFTSALNANSNADGTNNFITVNTSVLDAGVYQALYVWDPSASGGTGDYITVNQSSSATYIAPGQAFFVYSKNGGGDASFTTDMQTSQTGNIFKSGKVAPPTITLYAENGSAEKSTRIKYIEGMTTGIDPGYDAGRFDAGNNSFAVYTQLAGDNTNETGLDIQCLPTNGYSYTIPVGLNADAGSEVIFSVETSQLPTGTPVYLEDRQTGVFSDLHEPGDYYQASMQEDSKGYGRFYLHTKELQTGIETTGISNVKVLAQPKYNRLLIVGITSDNSYVEFYDLSGRKLMGRILQKLTYNEVPVSGIETGIYLVKVQDNGQTTSKKISWVAN